MKTSKQLIYIALIAFSFAVSGATAQIDRQSKQIIHYEDYAEAFIEDNEAYLSSLEEWQEIINQWLEKPLSINNEEADWLVEYKIISLYQLNKLKEYRLMFGDLLTLYELEYIDGWDFQTVKKVFPLVTVDLPNTSRTFKKFDFRSFRHSLVLKTAFNTAQSKGYQNITADNQEPEDPYYSGPPYRLAIRYDLEYRNKLSLGLRMEKDPGEPLLVPSQVWSVKYQQPDMLAGYVMIRQVGAVQSLILGNYRVNFGYGINLSGSQMGIRSRNGMSGMAERISPQTSVSETGFLRGLACRISLGKFSISCFGSIQNLDGNSVVYDSLTGKPISFSSIDKSGLHRSSTELSGRDNIQEKLAGGFIVYRHNWFKAGIIAIYNQFNAHQTANDRPYARFEQTGRENFITGFATTIWLPRMQFMGEISVSKNKGKALLTGLQLNPVPGIMVSFAYRNFSLDYQNHYGSGYISSGKNSDEKGIQCKLRIEMPRKYNIEILADESRSAWVSYDLASPSEKTEFRGTLEKAWPKTGSLNFSLAYINSKIENPALSEWICHTEYFSQYKIRLECRIEATEHVRFKSRIETNFTRNGVPGYLLFQDIEYITGWKDLKIWVRICQFDIRNYDNRITAYENDVQYDFSSFMHYGKGLRGILMVKLHPLSMMDLWIRFSTVYYTNKNIGTGWDEIGGCRQNEIEIQARFKWPD